MKERVTRMREHHPVRQAWGNGGRAKQEYTCTGGSLQVYPGLLAFLLHHSI